MNLIKNLKLQRRGIALLAQLHFFGDASKKMKVVGVTGTNGKTTTATLLYKVATALGHKAGLIGTVENIIRTDRRPALITTPSPINLHKLLNEMAEKGCEYVFMEVSSHALDQNRVGGIRFAGGIFTNLTHDHLDYHKTIGNYFGAKKKFFKMLPPEAFTLSNADDEYGLKMQEGIKAKKYTYGLKNPSSTSGQVPDFNEKINTKLLGSFNEYNTLAVYGAATLLGFPKDKVKEILSNIEPPRGRFENFRTKTGVTVIIDYAHTPDALHNVLETAKELKKDGGRLISVFGCGGDRDPMKRKIMGKIGATLSDIAIFTSDNPRNEDPEAIIEQMKETLTDDELKKVKSIASRREAILESVKLAEPGDIILCAGKGHEEYQEIKGVKHHFNDMEEYKNAY